MNTQYRKNLKAVATACKNYTDKKIEQALELLEDYNLSSDTVSQLSQTATAPSDVRTSSLIEVGGNCVKLAPSTASDDTTAKDKSIPSNTYSVNVDSVGGMSYKYNQLASTRTATKNITAPYSICYVFNNCDFTHKYLISVKNDVSFDSININFYVANSGNVRSQSLVGNTSVQAILNPNYSGSGNINCYYVNSTDITVTYNDLMLFDLTALGIDTTDVATAKSSLLAMGINVGEYNAYNVGTIRDTKVSEINVLDYSFLEIGAIGATGADAVLNTRIRVKNNQKIYLTAGIYTIDFSNLEQFVWYGYTSANDDAATYNQYAQWQDFGTTISLSNDCYVRFAFRYVDSRVISNVTELTNLRLTKNGVTTNLIAKITKQIPAEVQALEGYGWGARNASSYLNFVNSKFYKVVMREKLKNLNWGKVADNVYQCSVSATPKQDDANGRPMTNSLISTNYARVSSYAVTYDNMLDKAYVIGSTYYGIARFYIKDSDYADVTSFKNHFTDNDYIYYELATPVETDISSYLTDFNPITTDNNYTDVEFVNQYNADMPNKVSFYGTIKETLVNSFTINGVTTNITDTIESDGWSASNTVFNTRKTRDRQRIKRVGKIDLGTLTWTKYSNNNSFYAQIEDKKVGIVNALCSKYDCSNSSHTVTTIVNEPNTIGQNTTNNYIYFYSDDTANMTTEQFQTAMSGVFLYYELETPVITELNVTPDFHYLALASGETITFNNTNNQPCHNTIRYSIMEEKV